MNDEGEADWEEFPPDPEFLYNLSGCYNRDSYEEDLDRFPDYFDINGWPLFGDYDPYALRHPFTKQSWHLAPRVPGNDETSAQYDDWYNLAVTYEGISLRLGAKLLNRPKVNKEDPRSAIGVYRTDSPFAVAGNLAYLNEHIRPRLEELLEKRQSPPEFAVLWGEYRAIAENLGVAVEFARQREAGRSSQKKSNGRDPQRKWYVHWREHHIKKLEKSVATSNRSFLDVCWGIAKGELQPPDGFNKDWFLKALGTEKRADGQFVAVRRLTHALKRLTADKSRMESLLRSGQTDDPKIPSIDPDEYK